MKIDFLNTNALFTLHFPLSKTNPCSGRIYSYFSNIDIRLRLNSILLKMKNTCGEIAQSYRTPIFKDAKPNRLVDNKNLCELLSKNSERLESTYSLGKNILFKAMNGGIVNPPVIVFKKEKNKPLGVFKVHLGNENTANLRLNILSDLKSNGFVNLPEIYRNSEGRYLTKIEDVVVYFMQFLSSDPEAISFEQFLAATGDLHRHTIKASYSNQLGKAKLDEYQSRCHLFLDPWFSTCDPIFNDPLWQDIIKLSQYFNTESFRDIYRILPFQLIHGDNNQTNMIISDRIPYFIDFDSLRFDARILDLASYLRYGGFEQYINLEAKKELIAAINATYGKYAGILSEEERKHFHLIVAFSHIEFISWALKMLKIFSLENNTIKSKEFLQYVTQYKKQLFQILEILNNQVFSDSNGSL